MAWTRRWLHRLHLLLQRDAIERRMDDEIRHHVECETAEYVQRGMSPDAARRAALLNFGGVERIKEEARDARGGGLVDDLARDLRYAARVLRLNPGFTGASVTTLALGIAAATAIFSLVHGVLLRPLPYADPDRLVAVWERNIPLKNDQNVVSVENFEAWRDRSRAFEGMAALVPRSATLLGGALPERVAGAEVSPGYFALLGVPPMHGREFTAREAVEGAAVVVLSHGLWQRWSGGDPGVVGRPLPVAGRPHTIIGIMPPDFDPPEFGWLGSQELWFPFTATPENRAWGRFLLVVARLENGATLAGARAEMSVIARQRAEESPGNKNWAVTVIPLAEQITGDVRLAFVLLLAAVGLLLLIAIANVATLTMSLMARRHLELGIRRALGASDGRLFRQLLAQSALLGLLGSAVGVLAAAPALRILLWWLPPEIPRRSSIALDAPVLLVSTAVALAATLVFGTVAARRGAARALDAGMLREAGDGRSSARAGSGTLVTAEIALGLALSVLAMLMARTFIELRRVDIGFTAENLIAARLSLSGERYSSAGSQVAFFEALLERVRALPGVDSVAVISGRPFGGIGPATGVSDPLAPPAAGTQLPVADIRFADPDAFRTLRIPLVRGRLFDAEAHPEARPPILVSETMASTLWPGRDPVGRPVTLGLFGGMTAEVVGVVRDVHLVDPRTPPRSTAYLQASRFPDRARDLIIRLERDAEGSIPSLRAIVADLDATLPLYQVTTMSRLVDAAFARDRFTSLVLAAFAALALVLAAVGIFGVFSDDVVRRRKEIGIRLALGGKPLGLVRLILGQALRRAAVGIAAGVLLALAVSQSMTSLLFGVEPYDPASFVSMAAVVLALAVAATLIPAIRAVRGSPIAALREG